MEDIRIPMLGEKFPELTVKTTHGVKNLPEDYKGKWFVLFSHPGDFTPVCTTEFMEFSERAEEFKALNCELIGLSVDQVQAHMKWIEWIEANKGVHVPFPVIADELGRTAAALGMIHPAKGTNTVRAVFIVDDKGILRLMMYYPQEAGRNVDEVLRVLKALQVGGKYGVATPEKWPNNRHSGDKLIIPPASCEAERANREERAAKGEIEMDDWWLCYTDMK